MKIAFRHVPFDDARRESLNALCAKYGYETLWLPDSPVPTAETLKECEVLMGYFPPQLLKMLPNLRWLQTPAAGVDKLCGDIYASPDVILTNCSGAFGVAIAEYMLTGLLILLRNMPAYMTNQKRKIWHEDKTCRSIYKSTVTVVGMGDIGRKFAQRVKALGAFVRGVKRTSGTPNEIFDEVYTVENLKEAVIGADAVALCLPGTPETRGVFSAEIIAAMKKDAILINCGRGVTVDEKSLTQALISGSIAGAVLDVFETEPLSEESPLWEMENVIITPHISGHDTDPINAEAIFEIFFENLTRYFSRLPLTHVVNRSLGY